MLRGIQDSNPHFLSVTAYDFEDPLVYTAIFLGLPLVIQYSLAIHPSTPFPAYATVANWRYSSPKIGRCLYPTYL